MVTSVIQVSAVLIHVTGAEVYRDMDGVSMTLMLSPIARLCLVIMHIALSTGSMGLRAARSVRADSVNACGVYMLHLVPWNASVVQYTTSTEHAGDGRLGIIVMV